MFEDTCQLRVRYAETDKMGYVYYGNYPEYYEVGRVALLRKLGLSYKEMEDNGIMLPVLDLKVKYIRPAFYDDIIYIRTMIKKIPETRITFDYELTNENKTLINIGSTTLVFVDIEKQKPVKAPDILIEKMKKYF